jgi:hypothetical protein
MRALLFLLPMAGCGAMMVLCMTLMSRGGRRQADDHAPVVPTAPNDLTAEVEALRAEVAELRAERGGADASGERRA